MKANLAKQKRRVPHRNERRVRPPAPASASTIKSLYSEVERLPKRSEDQFKAFQKVLKALDDKYGQ